MAKNLDSKQQQAQQINQLPDGVTVSTLRDNYTVAATEYTPALRRAYKLDATDRGKLWEAVRAKFPKYQILPDSNHVSYIKNNILASIYTVGKSAKILPTSKDDVQLVENLNIAIECIWNQLHVFTYQMEAGERAALLNYGITQVGWDNSIVLGSADSYAYQKGMCKLKNIDPLKFMRDPFADSLDTASYCMTWGDYHKSILLSNPHYKDAFKSYLAAHNSTATADSTPVVNNDTTSKSGVSKPGYYRVFTQWVKTDDGKIHEIHSINNEYVLYVRQDIKPSRFPFAELYCNLPAGDVIGTSEPAKIFANSVAYNIMSSLIATAEYKNQRPPRFINNQAMLNVDSFTRHGNDADHTFVVQGDASKAVTYHQFPQPTQEAIQVMNYTTNDIKNITGVDDRYTGRDTGSVLTTGGIESMLDQVTMIDAPKVLNYERYTKSLTELIMLNYIEHSAISRSYYVQDKQTLKWKAVTVPFETLDSSKILFDYEISISSELPKNKSRIEAVANHLMEMQMQYQGQGADVDIITPQEWLMMQDLPMREYMQERMNIQHTSNYTHLVAQAVTMFSELSANGMKPEAAIDATAQTLAAQSQPGNKGLEDVANNIQGGVPHGM